MVLVHKVHEILRRVVLGAQVGLERAHDAGRRVPGVRVGPALLGLTEVLVVGEQVGQGGGDRRVEAGTRRDVQGRRGGDVHLHILLAHPTRGRRDTVHDQPALVVVHREQGVSAGLPALPRCRLEPSRGTLLLSWADLCVPTEGARGQDLWDLIALAQPPPPPGHETVRVHGPDGRLAKRDVVVVQETLELLRDLGALQATEDPL